MIEFQDLMIFLADIPTEHNIKHRTHLFKVVFEIFTIICINRNRTLFRTKPQQLGAPAHMKYNTI